MLNTVISYRRHILSAVICSLSNDHPTKDGFRGSKVFINMHGIPSRAHEIYIMLSLKIDAKHARHFIVELWLIPVSIFDFLI